LLGAGGGAFHVLAYMHVIWIGNGFLVLRSNRDDELKGSFENTSSVQWSRSGDMVDYDILLPDISLLDCAVGMVLYPISLVRGMADTCLI
jgi:hypothetical protein